RHALLREGEHARRHVGRHERVRLGCEHLRVESGTAAELHQAPQLPLASDSLPNHRSRLAADLQIDDAIVAIRDVRPELGLLVRHVRYSYSGVSGCDLDGPATA